MNSETYNLLKTAIEKHIFSDYEAMQARRLCEKYEEYERKRIEKREARSQMMKNLILYVLKKANKPLCPTEIQFILYRDTGEEFSCATIAWYCGRLCWDDKKLTYKKKEKPSR